MTIQPTQQRPLEGSYVVEYQFIQRFCLSNPDITKFNYSELRYDKTDFCFKSGHTNVVAEAKQRNYPSNSKYGFDSEGWFLEVIKAEALKKWHLAGYSTMYVNTYSDGVTLVWDLAGLFNGAHSFVETVRNLPENSATLEHPKGSGDWIDKKVYLLPTSNACYKFRVI